MLFLNAVTLGSIASGAATTSRRVPRMEGGQVQHQAILTIDGVTKDIPIPDHDSYSFNTAVGIEFLSVDGEPLSNAMIPLGQPVSTSKFGH